MMDKQVQGGVDGTDGHAAGVALIGVGGMGTVDIQAIRDSRRCQLTAIADPDEDVARAKAHELGVPSHSTIGDALAAHPDIEVVVLAVPHDVLVPTALSAIKAGVHVVAEKPGAPCGREFAEVLAALERRPVAFTANYWYRFLPSLQLARELVDEEVIGEMSGAELRLFSPKGVSYWTRGGRVAPHVDWRARWDRSGGGVLRMSGCHLLDALIYITRSSYQSAVGAIYAGHRRMGIEVEDSASVSFTLRSDACGSLVASSSPFVTRQEGITIWGSRGAIEWTRDRVRVRSVKERRNARPGRWKTIRLPSLRPETAIGALLDEFVEHIRAGTSPGQYSGSPLPAASCATPAEIMSVLGCMDAAYASAKGPAGHVSDLG